MNRLVAFFSSFWVALSLAIISLACAGVEFVAGNTGWVVADMVFAVYWLGIAWLGSRIPRPSPKGEDKLMSEAELEQLIAIRDAMSGLIIREKLKITAHEKLEEKRKAEQQDKGETQ